MTETATAPAADPFASLTAAPVDALFTGGGRPSKPVPPSVMALVKQSWNEGKDGGLKLRVPVADADTAKALAKELRRAGSQHEPEVTVRVTDEKDDKGTVVALRFLAGPKINRAKPESKADEAKPAETAKADDKPKAKAS